MLSFHGGAGNFREQFDDVVQGNAAADAYVEDFAGNVGGFEGQQVGLYGVEDVGEIASLFAVAEDYGEFLPAWRMNNSR